MSCSNHSKKTPYESLYAGLQLFEAKRHKTTKKTLIMTSFLYENRPGLENGQVSTKNTDIQMKNLVQNNDVNRRPKSRSCLSTTNFYSSDKALTKVTQDCSVLGHSISPVPGDLIWKTKAVSRLISQISFTSENFWNEKQKDNFY